MLSNEQYQHFQTFGFIILRQFFTAAEVATLSAEFEKGLDLAYAHRPFDGSERHWVPQMGPSTPLYASLLEEEHFWSITAQLYGEDANRYVGDTRWHPDHRVDSTEDCYGIKFAFYLDSVRPDTGVPGSHKNPLHDDLRAYIEDQGMELADIPSCACSSEPGDGWHSSFGGRQGRRMSTCVYYKNPETPAQERAARQRTQKATKHPPNTTAPTTRSSTPIGSASPLRQRWIERLDALGFLHPAA